MRRALPFVLAVAACNSDSPRPVRLELILRGSCPLSTHSYDISCVRSLVVSTIGEEGELDREQCTAISEPFANMQALVASHQVVEVLAGARARSGMRVELRAYHAVDKAPCTALDDADLLFWGASAVVDLTDTALEVLPVELECRPECDCADFDTAAARCPLAMPAGICAPPATLACRKPCELANDCYGGLLACEPGACSGGASSDCCTAEARQTCSPCGSDADCDSGVCVHNTGAPDEWSCAEVCPPLPGVTPCPPSMSCKRLDNGTYVRVGTTP